MNSTILSDEQIKNLSEVLHYVMQTELDFFQEEMANGHGLDSLTSTAGFMACKLANQLGLSTPEFNKEYMLDLE